MRPSGAVRDRTVDEAVRFALAAFMFIDIALFNVVVHVNVVVLRPARSCRLTAATCSHASQP